MAKIDELLALADSITRSSDSLLRSVSDLTLVVSLLLEIHHSIVSADVEIDNYSHLIARNNSYLNELQKLHEKSFFLEANLQTQDLYTNETSYSNLNKEYTYLWRSFGFDNLNFSVEEEEHHLAKEPLRSSLNHQLSISNLNLKPLRCKSTKVSKKKSRYRIAEAFNLNPLAPSLPPFPRIVPKALESVSEDDLSRNVLNASSSELSSIMDASPHRNSIASTQSYQLDNSDGLHKNTFSGNSLPLSVKSFKPLNIDAFDMDELEHLDFDYDSSSPSRDFDNFSEFLRKSRIDLQNSFPTLKKSVSYESVFSAPLTLKVEPPKKFHNPIDIVYTQKRQLVTQPTVEAIYSSTFDAQHNFKDHSRKLLAEETRPINISTKRAQSTNVDMTPKRKPSVGLFKLMNSPLGSPRGFCESPLVQRPKMVQKERQGSIDLISKSLATSFMNLVGTSPGVTTPMLPAPASSKSPPEKIKKMRKDLKDPIFAKNDLVSKRRPPSDRERRDSINSLHSKKPILKKEVKPAMFVGMNQETLKGALKESFFF